MAINLHEKYAKQIMQKFVKESIIAGQLSNEYSWSGVKTVKISTLQTVPMVDYVRNGMNRYGEPTEMQDTVQELTLTQDKAFALTIDKGNNADQDYIKNAGKALSLQIAERAVPMQDAYIFKALAEKAGKIAVQSVTLTEENICGRISEGTLHMDDKEVPAESRTLYISNAAYKLLKHSDEFLGVDSLGEKALAKGQVGSYDNMKVIKVPAGRLPLGMNFMIVYKNSATAPVKLNDTKIHTDPPGLSGALLEGRVYYDAFVFGAKADGIYVDLDGSIATAVAVPTVGTDGTITCDDGAAVIMYTLDGSDPRYSNSAKVYTSAVGVSGDIIKAYAYKEGAYPSEVATAVRA